MEEINDKGGVMEITDSDMLLLCWMRGARVTVGKVALLLY